VAVDVSNDGNLIVTGSKDRTVKIWTSMSGVSDIFHSNGIPKQLHSFTHDDCIVHVAFSPDCRLVVASVIDHAVYVWDVTSASMTAKLEGHLDYAYSVAFTSSASHILSGSLDKTMRLWELDPTVRKTSEKGHFGGSCIKTIDGHDV
jgi:glucose repression regulatory protein TUP1